MEEVMPNVFTWLASNWAWILVALGLIFEWTPVIKINPISSLFKWIGKKANEPIDNRLNEMEKKFDELDNRMTDQEKSTDMQRMANIRSLVLSFADDLRRGNKASHERFINVMTENGVYEELVRKHNIVNSVYVESYKYICNKYHECMQDNSFLA